MSEQAGIDRVEVVRIMPITIESPGVVSGLPLSPQPPRTADGCGCGYG